MSHTLQASSESISNILSNSQEAAKYLNEIHQFIDELNKSVQEVASVAKEITSNASRTKILALNASIEAARAGEAGLGFNIVAKEMSRVSELDTNSATDIENHLKTMFEAMDLVKSKIQDFDNASNVDYSSIENILMN